MKSISNTLQLKYAQGVARLVASLAFIVLFASAALADTNYVKISRNAVGATRILEIVVNKSMIIDLPIDASEVIVSHPETATVVMRSKRRAVIQAVSTGATNVFFLDANGGRISVVDLTVNQGGLGLDSVLARLIPNSNISAEVVKAEAGGFFSFENTRVILSGSVQSEDDSNKAFEIAAQFTGDEENVANLLTISGAQQVSLKVTIAEVQRDTIKQLGIELSGSATIGSSTTTFTGKPAFGGASGVSSGSSLGATLGGSGFNISATLKALERRGAVRTLAEPTLTAISGQKAKFLVGGEFPIPSGVDNGVITFRQKEFGVGLEFTPTVKSNGIIALQLDTFVSDLTTEGGVVISGITLPGTTERKASTSVELQSGSSLAIAGMIQEKSRQQLNEFPGLGKLPILGALFRSRDFIRSQTELVILVTPTLARVNTDLELPTDTFQFASDAETIFLGRMEKLYSVGGKSGGNYNGSVGFVLD